MKQFLFLYPIREYFDVEIDNGSFNYSFKQTCPDENEDFSQRLKKARSEEEKESIRQEARNLMKAKFRPVYAQILNECITKRYRQQNFRINFAVFDGSPVANIVDLQKEDKIFEVGIDFKTHCSERKYPDPDYILDQVGINGEPLRIAGFHMWDCVEKVAKKAHQRRIEVLVDEDLTEFLTGRINLDPDFRTDYFPTYNPRKKGKRMFDMFMRARRDKL